MSNKNPYKKSPNIEFKDLGKLDKEEAVEQVKELRKAINYNDYRYYVKNDPFISDNAENSLTILVVRLRKR